jgi:hypothetical protein
MAGIGEGLFGHLPELLLGDGVAGDAEDVNLVGGIILGKDPK